MPRPSTNSASMKVQAEKFDFPSMKLFERRTYDMKCNWKTYIDNYLRDITCPACIRHSIASWITGVPGRAL